MSVRCLVVGGGSVETQSFRFQHCILLLNFNEYILYTNHVPVPVERQEKL